jgi:hypothetical protein
MNWQSSRRMRRYAIVTSRCQQLRAAATICFLCQDSQWICAEHRDMPQFHAGVTGARACLVPTAARWR